MLQLSIAGRTGRDAQYRQTQDGGEICNFTVATDVGFGDRKQTVWVDVTRWGKGAKGLSECLPKGTSVAVTGEMSTREHEGKTYIHLRADRVTLLGGRSDGGTNAPTEPQRNSRNTARDDLDDDLERIPF